MSSFIDDIHYVTFAAAEKAGGYGEAGGEKVFAPLIHLPLHLSCFGFS